MSKHGGGGFFVAGVAGAGGSGSVTSQEMSVADAALSVRVDTQSQAVSVLSQAVSVISQQVSILSQAHSALSQAVSVLSDSVSNVLSAHNALSNTVSNALSSGDLLSNNVSILSVQNALVDGQQTEQIWEKIFAGTNTSIILLADGKAIEISATAGGTASVTSTELSAVSAQAASADAALSVRVDTQSQAISVLSQAVSVISQQVSVLSQTASVHSQRWSTLGGGAVSTYLRKNAAGDFAWEWGSVVAGGVGSVTSAQRDVLSQGISVLSVQAALVDGQQTQQIWEQIFPGTNTSVILLADGKAIEISAIASVTSQEVSVADAALSVRIDTQSQAISVLSQAISVISQQVSALSQAHSALSQTVSVISDNLSVLSTRFTSAASTLSHLASIVSNVSAQSAGGSATGLQNVVDMLSNKISQVVGGTGSVTSAELDRFVDGTDTEQIWEKIFPGTNTSIILLAGGKAIEISATGGTASVTSAELGAFSWKISGTTSVQGVQSVFNQIASVISNAFSAGDVKSNLVSAGIGVSAEMRTRTGTSVISGVALVDIVSLSVACAAGGMYLINGGLIWEKATSGGVAFGASLPALAGSGSYVNMWVKMSASQDGDLFTSSIRDRAWGAAAFSAVAAGQTAIVSVSITTVNDLKHMMFDAYLNISAAGSFQLMARGSVAGDSLSVHRGWIRSHRLL